MTMMAGAGMHAPLPPSMVPVGWEYPAHLLQQGTIRAGEPAQGAYSAADSVAAPQPGQAQQARSPSCLHIHIRARARLGYTCSTSQYTLSAVITKLPDSI